MFTFLKLWTTGQNSVPEFCPLSGYGPTPHDPVLQMLTVHCPGHLKIAVFYLCWHVHGFLERRLKYLPKLQLKTTVAYLECAHVSQVDKPLFFAGQLMTFSVLLKCISKNPGKVGGWGEGIIREFGMYRYILLYLKWITNKGTLLNVRWHPGWEGSLGKNGYMYMYGWVPLLYTWNYHNIVISVYANIKKKV